MPELDKSPLKEKNPQSPNPNNPLPLITDGLENTDKICTEIMKKQTKITLVKINNITIDGYPDIMMKLSNNP